ncbi:alpha/beta hydrolase [Rhodococcus sp. 15-649-1-2]|uniref:alpha/beta fold hydrolase n=1 Tax=Rhodococcoides fascians TaxID=1828 RepID=UPI000561DDA0|nr:MULTISPECIES: alpha/beta hydrolase [Rhodococcus]OZE87182.1 alpha/beta hydrolase [Rhodococcus sp. 15-649-1-2]
MKIDGTMSHFHTPAALDAPVGKLRYITGGSGSPILLLHTVRTQAEHFHRLIPLLLPHHTIYALDLPGMGYSDIVPGASYDEPQMRRGVENFLTEMDLRDVTIIGESMGAVLALTTAANQPGRARKVIAVNPYDFAGGLARSSLLARFVLGGVLMPGVGPLLAGVEPKPVMRAILHGGLVDKSALTDEYLEELLAVGRRPHYSTVARGVYANLPSLIAARSCYIEVKADVHIVYGKDDWSRPSDRRANQALLPSAEFVNVPAAGHFISLERPDSIAVLA